MAERVRRNKAASFRMLPFHNKSRDRILTAFHPHVSSAAMESVQVALLEEKAGYEGQEEVVVPDDDCNDIAFLVHPGIDIETDARHGWRKNAKDTSVVCLGYKTHKVLRLEHVTKADDRVTQRHELIGT